MGFRVSLDAVARRKPIHIYTLESVSQIQAKISYLYDILQIVATNDYIAHTQIPGPKSPRRLNFIRLFLIFTDRQHVS
jgi:hypothetical protein